MKLFKIERSNTAAFSEQTGIRGDFADVLWNGDAVKNKSGKVSISRFGPAVPAVYLDYGKLIATQQVKDRLSAECTGFTAIPATKKKIIAANWQHLTQDFFNAYFSLSDAIKKGKHSPAAAEQMPDLWLIAPDTPLHFQKTGKDGWVHSCDAASDFYYGAGDRGGLFVSEKARETLAEFGDLLVFAAL